MEDFNVRNFWNINDKCIYVCVWWIHDLEQTQEPMGFVGFCTAFSSKLKPRNLFMLALVLTARESMQTGSCTPFFTIICSLGYMKLCYQHSVTTLFYLVYLKALPCFNVNRLFSSKLCHYRSKTVNPC